MTETRRWCAACSEVRRLRRIIRIAATKVPKPIRGFLRPLLPFEKSLQAFVAEKPLAPQLRNAQVTLPEQGRKLSARYSAIVPFYNVGRYVDDFFHSIFLQGVDAKSLEVIAVDDGSTDDTAQRIEVWSRRFPDRIKCVSQENRGQSAARNTGLEYATGEWISFPDPDDFLSEDYLESVDREVSRAESGALSMVSCNFVLYREAAGRPVDSHPLRHRFARDRNLVSAREMNEHIQLSVNSVWFRRTLIVEHALRFDTRIVPSFEDAHFVNRYLLKNPKSNVVFLKKPRYYYRKRSDGTSTNDQSKLSPGWYLDVLRYGHLGLLAEALKQSGEVPRYIQRTILYDLFWRLLYLVDHPERAAHLGNRKPEFFKLLADTLAQIDSSVIMSFELPQFREEHRSGILGLKKAEAREAPAVYVRAFDTQNALVQLSYCSTEPDICAEPLVDGVITRPVHVSRRRITLLEETLCFEHFFWIPATGNQSVEIRIGGQPCSMWIRDKNFSSKVSIDDLRAGFRRQVNAKRLPEEIRGLRREACSRRARETYEGCWLLMDRDDKADDNAEHFYRYLMSIGEAESAFFVLREDVEDWQRLADDGFKLIPLNSREHHIALINAAFVISSHADQFVLWPVPPNQIGDLTSYRYVFLQHGVTKDNLSRWLNPKPISLFVTATAQEANSIAGVHSDYVFSDKEVALTGFARHDRLLSMDLGARLILVAPTWREYLLGARRGAGMKRDHKADFVKTDYACRWRELLRSRGLAEIATKRQFAIVLCPHPNLAEQMSELEIPDYVRLQDPRSSSMQSLIADCAVLVTDYSSLAFEAAYLEKPVLYYQFDEDRAFSGEHIYQKGYYDYARDGFGPVCQSEAGLLRQLSETLSGREKPVYAKRRRDAFEFRDGACCERIYQRLRALE